MKIKILSARREILSGEAREVVLPGEDGELSVWDFHQPCIVRLKPGRITIRFQNIQPEPERQTDLLITRGMARVDLLGVSILIEEAEKKI